MDGKKTLGGFKKLNFAPKKIQYDDVIEEMLVQEEEIRRDKKERTEKVSDLKKRQREKIEGQKVDVFSVSSFSDKVSRKGLGVEMKEEEVAEFKFEAEYEPQMGTKDKNDECFFGDDIFYLFNGIDPNEGNEFELEVDFDGTVELVIDKCIRHKMKSRECEKTTAVKIEKNIKEIGNVFNIFTVCRNY